MFMISNINQTNESVIESKSKSNIDYNIHQLAKKSTYYHLVLIGILHKRLRSIGASEQHSEEKDNHLGSNLASPVHDPP